MIWVCDHCGRDYGVFAIGLFCPDCGAPNLRLHFAREARTAGETKAQGYLSDFRQAVEQDRPELVGKTWEITDDGRIEVAGV